MQANAIDMAATPPQPEQPAGWVSRMGKSKFAVVLAGVLAISGAGGVGAVLFLNKGGEDAAAPAKTAAPASPDAFVDVPPMVVNLRSADGQARYLKLRFIIVAAGAERTDEVRGKLPLILDALQPFLRELRPEDLNGSAAVFRVKEEMMRRATDAVGAGAVRDILIQDLVQQ